MHRRTFVQTSPRVYVGDMELVDPTQPCCHRGLLRPITGFAVCAQDLHVGKSLQISSFPPRGAGPHPTLCLGNFIKSFLTNLIIR